MFERLECAPGTHNQPPTPRLINPINPNPNPNTACSGIHREFSHRVKSISLSTFSLEEVKALKEGGNEACTR